MNRQIYSPGDTEFNAGKHRIGQGIQSILAQNEENVSAILKKIQSEETETITTKQE